MKTVLLGMLGGLLVSANSRGALYAADNAGNYSAWGTTAGSGTQASAGTGFGSWSFSNTAGGNSSQNGEFLKSSAQVGQSQNINSPSGNSWGLYANSGQTANAIAPFSGGAMSAGQHLVLEMQNNYIQNSGGVVGFSLRDGSHNTILEFYFTGGGNDYQINVWQNASSGSPHTTSVGYTSGPLTLDFAQGSGNSWTLGITPTGGSTVSYSSSDYGSLWESSISEIRFFDYNAGAGDANNVYFNDLSLVPEPATWGLWSAVGLLGVGALKSWRGRRLALRA